MRTNLSLTSKLSIKVLAIIAAIALGSAMSYAQDKPQWVNKGVNSLNKGRYNDTYEFVKFHTHGVDLYQLQQNALQPLREYVMNQTGAKSDQIWINPVEGTNNYNITAKKDGETITMEARLVDQWDTFEDFEESYYEFEYYQLYVVSKPNVVPQFDDISLTKSYNAGATVMSLIPGFGQIYKGQNTKAAIIIGGEVAFVAAAIGFEIKNRDYTKMRDKDPSNESSWKSKALSMRVFRDISIGCAVGLYVYNLLDAALSKGAPRVVINKAKGQNVTITPSFMYEAPLAMSVCYTF